MFGGKLNMKDGPQKREKKRDKVSITYYCRSARGTRLQLKLEMTLTLTLSRDISL